MNSMRDPRLFLIGAAAVMLGIAVGIVAAVLALSPVAAGAAPCGSVVAPVYPADSIAACLRASAERRAPAYAVTISALVVVVLGLVLAVIGGRQHRA